MKHGVDLMVPTGASIPEFEQWKEQNGQARSLTEYYFAYPEKDPLHRYIEQLTEDLDKLTEIGYADYTPAECYMQEEDLKNPDLMALLKIFDHALQTREVTLAQLCGLEKVVFPPPKTLNHHFVWQLSYKLEALLHSYDIVLIYPEDYPPRLIYFWLYKIWDTQKIEKAVLGSIIEMPENERPPEA